MSSIQTCVGGCLVYFPAIARLRYRVCAYTASTLFGAWKTARPRCACASETFLDTSWKMFSQKLQKQLKSLFTFSLIDNPHVCRPMLFSSFFCVAFHFVQFWVGLCVTVHPGFSHPLKSWYSRNVPMWILQPEVLRRKDYGRVVKSYLWLTLFWPPDRPIRSLAWEPLTLIGQSLETSRLRVGHPPGASAGLFSSVRGRPHNSQPTTYKTTDFPRHFPLEILSSGPFLNLFLLTFYPC